MWNSEKYQWKINWIFNNIEWMKSTKMKSNKWYNLCDYLSDDMNDEINEKQLNIWFFLVSMKYNEGMIQRCYEWIDINIINHLIKFQALFNDQ